MENKRLKQQHFAITLWGQVNREFAACHEFAENELAFLEASQKITAFYFNEFLPYKQETHDVEATTTALTAYWDEMRSSG